MELFVGVFALLVGWFALVRSRQSEDEVKVLRREVTKLTQRQQQLLKQAASQSGSQGAPEAAGEAQQASAAGDDDVEVEEIEMTEAAR